MLDPRTKVFKVVLTVESPTKNLLIDWLRKILLDSRVLAFDIIEEEET